MPFVGFTEKKKKPARKKGDELVITLTIPLNHKRTVQQKEKLLQFITWCIEDRVTELNAAGDKDEETHADTHDIGSIILESKDGICGMREICI